MNIKDNGPKGPMPWLRLWHSFLDSAKVQRVTEVLRARYVNLLCVACKFDENGRLPAVSEIAFMLRFDEATTRETLDALVDAKLVDRRAKSYWIHDWEQWQSGKSKAAEKQKRYRERRHALRNALPTRDVTEASRVGHSRARVELELELETEKEEDPPTPPVVTSLGPEYQPVARYAEEQGGDVSWALWSDRMGRAGHPARSIRLAIDEAAGNGKLTHGYVATILRRWAVEGEPAARNGQAPRRAEPVIRIHRKGDPM